MRLLHVEDDDAKARCWARVVRTEALRAGLVAHPADVEVIRCRTLADVPMGAWDVDAVVTDMCLPAHPLGAAPVYCGLAVTTAAAERGIPLVVISGGMRVPWWEDRPTQRWPDHGDERAAIQWLMRTVASRRAVVADPRPTEVCS